MKTLEDERYVVIKAYKCTVSEIWRDFFVLRSIYCVYVVSLHIDSTESMMNVFWLKINSLCIVSVYGIASPDLVHV